MIFVTRKVEREKNGVERRKQTEGQKTKKGADKEKVKKEREVKIDDPLD